MTFLRFLALIFIDAVGITHPLLKSGIVPLCICLAPGRRDSVPLYALFSGSSFPAI